MRDQLDKLTRQQLCAVVAVVSALLFHVVALFLANNAVITMASSTDGYVEHRGIPHRNLASLEERKKEIQKKNAELVAIFNRSLQPKKPNKVDTTVSEDTSALNAPKLKSGSALAIGTAAGKHQGSGQSIGAAPEHDFTELLLPDDELLASEMTPATSAIKGQWETADWRTTHSDFGVMVGSDVEESPGLPSLQTHSGVIDAGDIPPMDAGFAASMGMASPHQLAAKGDPAEWLGDKDLAPLLTRGSKGEATDESLGTIVNSDHFKTDTLIAPRSDGQGYYFRINLYPRTDIHYKRITKNVFFLIDRSHSIARERYNQARMAVQAALRQLHPHDTFNILVFDKKVERLAEENIPVTSTNLAIADKFLAKQGHGGWFAGTELCGSLHKIIPEKVKDKEVNVAILLSDGDTFLFREDQRRTIYNWTMRNRGRVSLFSLATGKNNNLPLLDYISSMNKGWMLYVPEYDQQEGILERLMATIRNPIGKKLAITGAVADQETRVSFFPRSHRVPDLYETCPFTILGTMDHPVGINITMTGKYYDTNIHINRRILFPKVESEPSPELEKEVAMHLVYEHYDNFLKDGNEKHLSQAKPILDKLQLPMAFQ